MATDLYVTAAELTAQVQDPESSGTDSWEALASAVSRLFDQSVGVPDGFFLPAEEDPATRSFRGVGTEFIRLDPYIAGSIDAITLGGDVIEVDGDDFYESEGYLVFGDRTNSPAIPSSIVVENGTIVSVSARWGFAAVPAIVKQACIEQALFIWRKKDLAFSELSGVPSAAVTAKLAPTFALAVEQYRGLYSKTTPFA